MTKRKKKDARQLRNHGRDKLGRFKPGHSGNPNGRPLKEPESPKLPDELLAEAFMLKVQVTGEHGTTRTISAYERLMEDMVDSFATAKLREKMQMIEWLEKRSFFHHMKDFASGDAGNPFEAQHDEWLEQRLEMSLMSSLIRRLTAAQGKSAERKSDKDDELDSSELGPPFDE